MDQSLRRTISPQIILRKIKSFYTLPPVPFSGKREWNKLKLGITFAFLALFFTIAICKLPEDDRQDQTFNRQSEGDIKEQDQKRVSPQNGPSSRKIASKSLLGGVGESHFGKVGTGVMILKKPGDTSTELPPGTRMRIKIENNLTLTTASQPVIGMLTDEVMTDFGPAIPAGTFIFGDAAFDEDRRRAQVHWKSIQLHPGQAKAIEALALGADLEPGLDGVVHSDSAQNTVGSLMTHFIQGVASGSITRTQTGQSSGGLENGLLEGASDTAKERADLYAQRLKKEHAYTELKKGDVHTAILTQSFSYRDSGGVN